MAKKKARRRQTINKDESKSERFVRVVTPRVSKAVKAIKVIGYCAGTAYESTPEQVAQITSALQIAIRVLVGKFEDKAEPEGVFDFTK